MFQTKVVEKLKTHILCSTTFSENRAIYEITWKTVVERGRPQMITWRMRIACWIPKATNAHCNGTDLPLSLLYINCVRVIRHTDHGQGGGRNLLLKSNNMWLNICL